MKNICFHLNRKVWLVALLSLVMAFPALAQKITVHGTVLDEQGEPLIGATVMEKGTTNGTAADFDGHFELSVSPNATLVVSYVGYDPMDVALNGRTDITIVMKENAEMLNEVMVIGYGTVKKSDATGSVAVIKPDEIEAGISTSAQDLLVGASPGVVVTATGGAPQGNATIRIRGGASLSANNDPLIVLDGVPLSGDDSGLGNSIGMISPDNIESMTILKDASATAIYGSRASNGVIIITTKKGRSGRPQVNFSATMTVNTPRKTWGVLDASEFRNIVINRWGEGSDQAAAIGTYDTNWQKEVLRTAISQEYNLSVGGTVGFLPYRISGSYTGNSGIMRNTSMQRVTAGINLTPEFFNGLLKIQANVKGYYIRNNWSGDDAIGSAIGFNPTVPVYDYLPTGNPDFPYFYNGYYTIQGANNHLFNINADLNPVARQNEKNSYSDVWRSNGNFQVDYAFHFLPELHANLNLGYDVMKSTSVTDTYANSPLAWNGSPQQNGAGTHYWYHYVSRNTLLDFYLNYQKDFEKIQSNLNVMVGYSWQRFDNINKNNGTIYTHNGFTISKPAEEGGSWLNPALNAAGEPLNVPGTVVYPNGMGPFYSGKLMLISFFGRVNYSFKDTYLITFTLRDDGTSRFSKTNRWGLFPSVALGWKINEMAFMEQYRADMNEFKLRLGWGVTGQQDVGGWFPAIPTYTQSSQGSFYPNLFNGNYLANPNGAISGDNVISNTYYPRGYNANLKWEETTTWNVGVDLGWWNNRLTVNLDWYLRNTKDLLSFVTASPGAFTTNMLDQNIGTLRNIGVEGTIAGRIFEGEKFTWTSSLNVAWNKNEITKLNNEGTYVQVGGISGGNGNSVQVHQVGYPAFSYLLYEQIYDQNGQPIEGAYVDQDGNGVIDANDLVIKHSRDPKVTMAWNNTFNIGNWDIGFQLRASIGNYVYNNALSNHCTIEEMWQQQTLYNMVRNDFYFQGGQTTNTLLSDYWLENAGFVRCDNITVGYTWPNLLNDHLRLRLYGAVQNPFIITKYKGLDPEVFSGIDNNVYPRPVSFTIGIIASF